MKSEIQSEKKTAIVTGGSRGIGRAICLELAASGMNIVFCYSSREEEAVRTKKECEARGASVRMLQGSVTDPAFCKELVSETKKTFGSVDVLVNNAGITRDNLAMRMSDEEFDAVLDVNLKGAFYMMREVSRIMLRQKSGRIINMSSVVGVMGNAGQVNYAAAKAGLIGMTKTMARELASRGITVNAIAPGMIETDMTRAMTDQAKEQMQKVIPMGRMGTTGDIAGLTAFLAGDKSGYITGQVICIDGGMAI